MADLPDSTSRINDVEVAQDAPVTESLHARMGGAINYLLNRDDRTFPLKMDFYSGNDTWTCPAGVTKVLLIGIGGGGGGGGGAPTAIGVGQSAGGGNATTFDAQTIANGGSGGQGGRTHNATGPITLGGLGGQGSNNGGNGGQSPLPIPSIGARGGGGILINGVSYGFGGNGGSGATSAYSGGGGGGSGFVGYREYTVVPGNNYAVVIGTGGTGTSNSGGGFGGGAGSAGALMIIYTYEAP